MDNYLNIFAYQTLGLQQFAGAFPDWERTPKENTHSREMLISLTSERGDISMIPDKGLLSITPNVMDIDNAHDKIEASVLTEKIDGNLIDE